MSKRGPKRGWVFPILRGMIEGFLEEAVFELCGVHWEYEVEQGS